MQEGNWMTEFESAKVYVFDFHMKSIDKGHIALRKEILDEYFFKLLLALQLEHGDMCQVFLRKH